MTEQHYNYPVNQFLTLGEPDDFQPIIDLAKFGITAEHIEELKRMVLDPIFNEGDPEDPAVYAPVYAWRALGALRAESAVDTLLKLADLHAQYDDDWTPTELPTIFGMIGPSAIQPLSEFWRNRDRSPWVRTIAVEGVSKIAEAHPAVRQQCIDLLLRQFREQLDILAEDYDEEEEIFTSFTMSALLDLKATEAAPLIESAFAVDRIDPSVSGDWEDVQIELGLKTERVTPQPHYSNLALTRSDQQRAALQDKMQKAVQKSRQISDRKAEQTRDAKKKAKRKQATKSKKKNRKK